MSRENLDPKIYSAMQTGNPYKSYIKTMLGMIYVVVLNPFNDEPEGITLRGNPRGKDKESCIIDLWSEREDVFFKRTNKRHFDQGHLLPYERKVSPVPQEKPLTEYTDDELKEKVLKLHFFSLQSIINKIESQAVIFRLLDLAREEEKSEKIIKLFESRLSELQEKEYTQPQ